MTETAKQGHRYDLFGKECLALESGEFVRIAMIDRTNLWPLTDEKQVYATFLAPMPMVYFHGQVPL